jgi:hypothetical protein
LVVESFSLASERVPGRGRRWHLSTVYAILSSARTANTGQPTISSGRTHWSY